MPRIKKIESDQQKHEEAKSPQEEGEESISGDMADLESDDNVLDAAHKVGLYENADEEHPEELGLDSQTDKDDEQNLEED